MRRLGEAYLQYSVVKIEFADLSENLCEPGGLISKARNSRQRNNQCDQITRLFAWFLAIHSNENLPNGI